MKIELFGYELIWRKSMRLHISHQLPMTVPEEWTLEYPIDKRISAMGEFAQYIFRDYDNAILRYGECAAMVLEDIMKDLRNIRNHLKSKGATEKQLKPYDQIVCDGLNNVRQAVKDRGNIDIIRLVERFDVEYYNGII